MDAFNGMKINVRHSAQHVISQTRESDFTFTLLMRNGGELFGKQTNMQWIAEMLMLVCFNIFTSIF